ncbi:glycosyltransferase [bacterium]|nr:glycosyltransferase [bacterium]
MKVSIITITYNSGATVRDTMQSIAKQTYPNIEHIIIDGVSKDRTLEIVAEFPHVAKVISEPDKGIYDAMNKGIQMATGEIIGILNSDDIFANEDVLRNVVDYFQLDLEVSAVYGNISYFKTEQPEKIERTWISKTYYDNFFEDGEVPPHPALFIRKTVYDKIGLYYPDFKVASDYEYMLKMLKVHKYKSMHLDKILVKMRLGGESSRGIYNLWLNNKEVLQAWKMNKLSPSIKFYFMRPFKKIKQLISD